VELSDDPVEESHEGNSRLPNEELGETPIEQGLREQRRAAIPTQEAMRLVMATLANGSVGELVAPDSDPDRNKNVAITRPQAQWPPDDTESYNGTDEDESVDEHPGSGNNARQSTIQNDQNDKNTLSGAEEDADSRLTVEEATDSRIEGRNADVDGSQTAESTRDYPQAAGRYWTWSCLCWCT